MCETGRRYSYESLMYTKNENRVSHEKSQMKICLWAMFFFKPETKLMKFLIKKALIICC